MQLISRVPGGYVSAARHRGPATVQREGEATKRAIGACAGLWLLAGCVMTPVTLRHPQTGATVQCGPYFAASAAHLYTQQEREARCITDYQLQGYQRVPE